jgi:hypothetical protein
MILLRDEERMSSKLLSFKQFKRRFFAHKSFDIASFNTHSLKYTEDKSITLTMKELYSLSVLNVYIL